MKITIFGCGYVGLVTGACFAEVGNHVQCVDIDESKVASLNAGECPIYEPGLQQLIQKNLATNRLTFTTDTVTATQHGDIIFIAVGTPSDVDGSADLQYVLNVAESIGIYLSRESVIVTKSTVPVGTADKVREVIKQRLQQRGVDYSFYVASNPEFLKEGAAVEDFMRPDRIVIGTNDTAAIEQLKCLYAPFNRNHDRLIVMDSRSSELTKYAANAMLATKISFMNEMSCISERVGADIEKIRIGIGTDPRIGFQYIYPGCGYGGSCFPKDVRALQKLAQEVEYQPQILNAVEEVNKRQKHVLFAKVKKYFKGDLKNKVIAIWGLAFKPNTDDMREASSRVFMEALWEEGASIRAYDPVAMNNAFKLYGDRNDLLLCKSAEDALRGADVLAILTEWPAFRSPDFQLIKSELNYPAIFDGRNLYQPEHLKSELEYYSIGRSVEVEV